MLIKLLQEFLVVSIIVYCLNMIYFYFKNKSKNYRKTLTSEMNFLIRVYGIDLNLIGIKKVERDISIINSIIITIDLLILYNIESLIFAIIIIIFSTFILIGICYGILGRIYSKMLYRG